ncbi:Predicted glycosyltransferase, family I [uncultured Desulfatiglans sp.]|uniref:Predicted glycosyltransferase, family I n=1 Tax=Uncultured Desulfatiglans sp. TaxID=1748965 RepID=A0A653A6Q9_UNCDX|nr:Predicted glycosyltransferase, family I [uncultured Desulfatiglans sp.]
MLTNNNKTLFIVDQVQFGYHTGNYYICKYLRDSYSIIYICKEHGLSKIEMNGVRSVYVSRKGNSLVRSIRFFGKALQEIRKHSNCIIFIKYLKGISLALRLSNPSHLVVLDVRSASVSQKRIRRWLYDSRLKFETKFFKNITVISQGLADKLNMGQKAHILPLGADVISSTNKNFDQVHLLYVGTLVNRNIDVTIHGFKRVYDELVGRIPLSYSIIGTGSNDEESSLRELVDKLGLKSVVLVIGRIPHTEIAQWFDNTNIGVSYIPLTDYFDVQPPLKTFEYLLSGMPVIATHTSENRKVISEKNGVLVGESVNDFYLGIKKILQNRASFDSEAIRNGAKPYMWKAIVTNNLKPYLQRICE